MVSAHSLLLKHLHTRILRTLTYQLVLVHTSNQRYARLEATHGDVETKIKCDVGELPLTNTARGGCSIKTEGGVTSSEVSSTTPFATKPIDGIGTQRCESKTT